MKFAKNTLAIAAALAVGSSLTIEDVEMDPIELAELEDFDLDPIELAEVEDFDMDPIELAEVEDFDMDLFELAQLEDNEMDPIELAQAQAQDLVLDTVEGVAEIFEAIRDAANGNVEGICWKNSRVLRPFVGN